MSASVPTPVILHLVAPRQLRARDNDAGSR